MAGNLTRDEAACRARLLSVHSYSVELDFTRDDELFTSITTATFGCSEQSFATFGSVLCQAEATRWTEARHDVCRALTAQACDREGAT